MRSVSCGLAEWFSGAPAGDAGTAAGAADNPELAVASWIFACATGGRDATGRRGDRAWSVSGTGGGGSGKTSAACGALSSATMG
jgi:hypothetical protein